MMGKTKEGLLGGALLLGKHFVPAQAAAGVENTPT